MASINQATIIGFVGDEPKIINTNNGTMATLSIATTEKGYTKQDGTVIEDKTDWHNVVVFGRLADVVKNFVHKGSSLYVQGKMRTRAYDDKNGVKRYITEVICETLQMLDRKQDGQHGASMQATGAQYTDNYEPPF